MPKPGNIKKQDSDLFRQSIGKVKRIRHDSVVFARPKPALPKQDSSHADNTMIHDAQDAYTIKANDELLFKRPGIQQQLLRKLKRGQISIETELDLHGMTLPSAKKALAGFFEYCCEVNHRCVRIIHGKGKGSENKLPILKNGLDQWLRQQDYVLAFCSAQPTDGGTGAVYVLMKRQ